MTEFINESKEILERIESNFVALENSSDQRSCVDTVFRDIHTLKGSSGFYNLSRLENIAHSTEEALDRIRQGNLQITKAMVNVFLEAIDEIKQILEALGHQSAEPSKDDTQLIQKLHSIVDSSLEHKEDLGQGDEANSDLVFSPEIEAALQSREVNNLATQETLSKGMDENDLTFSPEIEAALLSRKSQEPFSSTDASAVSSHSLSSMDFAPEIEAALKARDQKKDLSKPDDESIRSSGDQNSPTKDAHPSQDAVVNESIRVNVRVLEEIMNMVGELVLTRNQLVQIGRADENSHYGPPIQHLNRITSGLQESVVKTRMQPIGSFFSKVPRMVRDLCASGQKKIELEILGQTTELDRAVHQSIQDPLTHMIRNAVDHGIETSAEREQNNKSPIGKLKLNAYHEAGFVIIEVSDDGRGMDLERIREQAVAKGLIDDPKESELSEVEIRDLIFKPGFSTATEVTHLSGRGVGMDVVKTNVERMGGVIEYKTELNQGTSFKIKIPLTLAIVSAFLCELNGAAYAIPQSSVSELVRITEENRHLIESIRGTHVLRLRNKLLPLVGLADVLNKQKRNDIIDTSVLVINAGAMSYGLVVDEVCDTQEIVVKPIGRILKKLHVYSGTTILGDGRVVMILDVAEIARNQNLVQADALAENDMLFDEREEKMRFLLFESKTKGIKGVPLSLVSRLEEFKANEIEICQNRRLVQYRNSLLSLVSDDDESVSDPQPVIVFAENKKAVGLMVHSIQDIVETPLQISISAKKPGTLGSAIVNGKATEVLDVHHFIREAKPDWFGNDFAYMQKNKLRLLYIEPSEFVGHMMLPLLEREGFAVGYCQNLSEARRYLHSPKAFDIVLMEVNMPGEDGHAFVDELKKHPSSIAAHKIALTTWDTDNERKQGIELGFDEYLAKNDRAAMLKSLKEIKRQLAEAMS